LNNAWTITHRKEAESTNLLAAGLPAWHAIRADVQTAGRGRFQRSWVSDAGGLWLSAVVPIDITSEGGRLLPLAAGLAVCDTLRSLGVQQLRMRWPNDVMVGNRKIAGLLIDQFKSGLAVVGIGVNVFNKPEEQKPELRGSVARLADVATAPLELDLLTAALLDALRSVASELHAGRFPALLERVNALWHLAGEVELDLDHETRRGRFGGVDGDGRLILIDKRGAASVFPPEQARHLSELTLT